jgi:valyl-tRNA synthetase
LILAEVRRAKSDAKTSMRTEVELVAVTADKATLDHARRGEDDLLAAARADSIEYSEGEFEVLSRLKEE